MSQHNWSSLYVYYHLKLAERYIAENLVFRDKIEIFSFLISFFETRLRFLLSLSRFSRRDRDFCFNNLGFRDVSRQNLEQNLTRFFEIEISRWALIHSIINYQSLVSKVLSRYLHSPGSHQSTRFLEWLTDWLTHSLTNTTSRASCDAKNAHSVIRK